jgi:3-phosphoglycerate kinase
MPRWWASRSLCGKSAAGLLMERELAYLGKALSNPERPFVAVLGGAKVSDKIEVVENLMKVADAMLIGGGMAYTFLKSQGCRGQVAGGDGQAGSGAAFDRERRARKNFPLLLPSDHVVGAEFKADTQSKRAHVRDSETPDGWMGLDIGPETSRNFRPRSRAQKPLCGMGRWAFSRCRRSRRARSRWPSRCRGDRAGRLRLWAAAIRWRRCIKPA